MAVRLRITDTWRAVARSHGFEEYDGPPLESLDLYVAKSGPEIVAQLYTFEDRGGRAVALRPEMTPTLARMVGARAGGLRKPIRWFSTPQLFRYERTQRGRLREHFQWNVDVIGEDHIGADVEVLAVALDALVRLGLGPDDIVARYSDRRLLERVLLHAGIPEGEPLAAAYAAIDKLGREPADVTRRKLEEAGSADAGAVLGVFEASDLDAFGQRFADAGIAEELDRLRAFRDELGLLGLGDFVRFDPAIVRGLAYYTGTVFEIFDRAGELRAICGGGRYDDLLASVGNVSLPAVGFGMGDVVLGELLADRGLLADVQPALDWYVVAVTEEDRADAVRVARALRARGQSALYALRPVPVGKQFKEADARGARAVVVIGPDERARGEAVVRDMTAGEERRVPLAELLASGA